MGKRGVPLTPRVFLLICMCASMYMTYCLFLNSVEESKYNISPTRILNCSRYPSETDITTDNDIWQVLEIPKGFVKILNAYLDARLNKTVVRLNVNSVKLDIDADEIYCQFWFDGVSNPHVVKATEFISMWYWEDYDHLKFPYLITCPVVITSELPSAVSLTAKPCDVPENLLKIIDNQPKDGVKKKFGVCSKQVSYPRRGFTIRFIEWLHLVRILGAEKVHFYNKYVHPDFFEVLRFFEKKNYIEVLPFLEPSGISMRNQEAKRIEASILQQNMLNDCFYRVKNLYEFVAIFDFDEVIMPTSAAHLSWEDLLNSLELDSQPDSYVFDNLYYPHIGSILNMPEVPQYYYMLRHTQRLKDFTEHESIVKSFYNTDKVQVVHNYQAIFCLNDNLMCNDHAVPTNISQVSHYRKKVHSDFILETVEDRTIWKFRDRLVAAVEETLRETRFDP